MFLVYAVYAMYIVYVHYVVYLLYIMYIMYIVCEYSINSIGMFIYIHTLCLFEMLRSEIEDFSRSL